MKKTARIIVLAAVAVFGLAAALPAHATIAGSDPRPPATTNSLFSVVTAVLSEFGL